MPIPTIEQTFENLFEWCRRRDFSGYDPFDALNSRIFQSTPLKHSRLARLGWTQALKRSPINLRGVALVPPQKNSKGLALFALAALSNYRRKVAAGHAVPPQTSPEPAAKDALSLQPSERTNELGNDARYLLDELLQMKINGYSGAAWGYNFGWQSRNFFAPQGTPTIVPSAFAVRALLEGFEAFHEDKYLAAARSACDFILNDLNRTADSADELCFSYSPLDKTQIFNASLFAAETLASVGKLTGESGYCELALRAARFVVTRQNADGSWAYGTDPAQHWIDNFHTAYVLRSLSGIINACGDRDGDLTRALERGYRFWRNTFFLADGWPKYYDDALYPADAHAAATAIATLVELRELDSDALIFAETIASWTLANLRDREGYFYYQRRRFQTVRTPFMRWSEAWMLYAFALLLEAKNS